MSGANTLDELASIDGKLALTTSIVKAYVGYNSIPPDQVPALIQSVHTALGATSAETPQTPALIPAVSVRKSVTDEYLVCLEDGKKFKSLKRHLRTHYGLTPEQYREKWGLPQDYPMVAPSYAAARSALARKMGLGRPRAPEPEVIKMTSRRKKIA